jgi:hypothetical protein
MGCGTGGGKELISYHRDTALQKTQDAEVFVLTQISQQSRRCRMGFFSAV